MKIVDCRTDPFRNGSDIDGGRKSWHTDDDQGEPAAGARMDTVEFETPQHDVSVEPSGDSGMFIDGSGSPRFFDAW